MRYLAQVAVRRPIAFCMLAITLLLFGAVSWRDLDISLFPDIQSPTVMVSVQSSGKSAVEMERLYAEIIERELFTVKGLTSIEQTAMDGRLVATVNFDYSVDFDMALIEVNRHLAKVSADAQVDSVTVRRFDSRQLPVFVLGLTHETAQPSLAQLRTIAQRQLVPAFEQLPDVAEVRMAGGQESQVSVTIKPVKLAEYKLTLGEIIERIVAENFDLQAGTVQFGDQTWLVKSDTRFEQVADIENVVIKYDESGSGPRVAIKVKDVAHVAIAEADTQGLVRIDGQQGIGLFIYKEGDANTVNVAKTVRQAIAEVRESLPGLKLSIVADEARVVEASIGDVEVATIVGLVLATAVLTIFLRRPEPIIIVALAIPVSLMTTLLALNFAGFSLNLMTLGGLALGTGMLVDNAIVVVESIFRQQREGATMAEAAAQGAGSVAAAITTSTLTTCVVFLPVVFIHGIAAKLMAGIAFTVVVSLFTSLLVAIFLIPALASILIKKPSNADIDPGSQWIERKVLRILKTPLRALAVAAALTGLAGLGLTSLGTNLLPPQDPDRFSLSITTADGQKAEETNKVVELIESMIHQAAQGQVAISLAEVGRLQDQKSDSFEQMTRRENQANLTVLLREGSPSVDEIRMRLSPLFKTLHHVEIEWLVNTSTLANALEQEQQDVVIEVAGKSLSQIQSTAKQLLQQLRQDPQLWNIQSSIEQAAMEYSLLFDRRLAASYGLSLQELEVNLQAALGGVSITQMTRGDEQTSVVINNPSLQEGELANLTLWSETGHWIRLGDIADIRLQPAANQILRRNQERVVELTAMYAANTELQQARQNLHALVAGFKPPVGVAVRLAGGEVARSQNMTELNWAIVLAVLLVFMLLAGSFESFLQPFTVLSSVPLALIGVACALVPLGQPIGIMVMLGLVVLSGIAVNDSILLVQKAQQLIASGVRPHAALAKAAAKRLRPIIMTTATTVAALLPLGLGIGESAELRAPLAWTVIGGLLTATLGSLTIVPCLYLVLGNFEKTTAATARPVELSELPYDKKAS